MELNWNVQHVAQHGDYKIEVESNPDGRGWDWTILRDGDDEWEYVEESDEPRHLQLALLEAGQALEQILARDEVPPLDAVWTPVYDAIYNTPMCTFCGGTGVHQCPGGEYTSSFPKGTATIFPGLVDAKAFPVLQNGLPSGTPVFKTDADSIAKHKDTMRRIQLIDDLDKAGYSLSPAEVQRVLIPDSDFELDGLKQWTATMTGVEEPAPALAEGDLVEEKFFENLQSRHGSEIKLPDDPNKREDVVRLLTTGTSSVSGYDQILNNIKAESAKLKP